ITNEASVDNLMSFWSGRVIRSNMKHCSNLIRQRLGLPAAMPSLLHKIRRVRNPGNIKEDFEPDWSVAVPPNGQFFVMGESKVSAKWKSEWLDKLQLEPRRAARGRGNGGNWAERQWPLRQIATYCVHGGTRYGLIFTARELVVLRVFKTSPGNDRQASVRMEWKAIPWSASGPQLTVNLALWALIMMAVNDRHR
ncbi:hypothetical protein QBC37DRAFT_267172, partial [Rhypophila decipiens]